jgi:NADP-dependent 3-hydroxy acid dehydrogenase YdfG
VTARADVAGEGALAGRTAVVTGASRGIGLAVAQALAADGMRVVLLARRQPALEAAVASIGERAYDVPCDLTRSDDVVRALATIERSIGLPDLLVNNAGAFALGAVGLMPPDDVDQLLALNVVAPYRLLYALVPGMRLRGSGHVITIGSVADRQTFPENAAYAAGKFGARAMHQVLRDELRGSGVRVSLVSPGPVDTTLWDPIAPETRPGFPTREQMLRPTAVAEAVRWVASCPATVNIDELRLSHA